MSGVFLYETKSGDRVESPPATILENGKGHVWHKGEEEVPVRLVRRLENTMNGSASPRSEKIPGRGVELVTASSLEVTRPSFTWQLRVPDKGVTLIAGLEGLGKTVAVLDIAARATRGQLAGDRKGRPGDIVYVGIEDDWQSVTVPRLIAAGADLDRVHFVKLSVGGVFSFETDLPSLRKVVEALDDLALVIIDPLDSHLGEGVDSHRKSEVQRSVQHVAEMAQEQGCAVLGIGHLNKNELSKDVLMRVIGSKGFTTSARSVLAIGEHPENEGERLLVLRKSNFVDRRIVPALRFALEPREIDAPDGGPRIETVGVAWLGEEPGIDADSILGNLSSEERTERDDAADWLHDLLEDGPCPYKEIERLASEAGIARATLHRARKLAKVVADRDNNAQGRPSTWRLEGVSSPGVSSQSLTLHSETKDVTPVTRENSPDSFLSSHVSESGSDETEPRPEEIPDRAFSSESERQNGHKDREAGAVERVLRAFEATEATPVEASFIRARTATMTTQGDPR